MLTRKGTGGIARADQLERPRSIAQVIHEGKDILTRHDFVTFVGLGLTSRAQLAAENLFLHEQVALYQERQATLRFLIHDRKAIYAPVVGRAVESMRLRVLKTFVPPPQVDAFGEGLFWDDAAGVFGRGDSEQRATPSQAHRAAGWGRQGNRRDHLVHPSPAHDSPYHNGLLSSQRENEYASPTQLAELPEVPRDVF